MRHKRDTVTTFRSSAFGLIQTQPSHSLLAVLTMAVETVLCKDRANIASVIEYLLICFSCDGARYNDAEYADKAAHMVQHRWSQYTRNNRQFRGLCFRA